MLIRILSIAILITSVQVNGSVDERLDQTEERMGVEGVAKNWSFVALGQAPVQSGGRLKPLDSFAREIVLFETGSRSYQGWNSLDLILSWISSPQYWDHQPIIQVGREDVRRQLNLEEKRVFYSPDELFKNPILAQYSTRIGTAETTSPPGAPRANPREQELKAVLDRVGVFHGIVSGQNWLLVPNSKNSHEPWGSLVSEEPEGEVIRDRFVDLLKAYQSGDEGVFDRASVLLRSAIEEKIPGYTENAKNKVYAEMIYNKTRPFLVAWIFYLGAAIFWILSISRVALVFTGFASLSQIFGIALRCFVAGRPPVTNMYESIIWVSLGILIFASVLYYLHRDSVIMSAGSVLALLALIAGDAAPAILDPSLHPLVPVLRSNYWLTVHVLTITLGYAAFALTLGLANVTLFHFLRQAQPAKIRTLNQFTYRAMQFGVVLIAAGTILGGIWADYSWGRFWGWDPKEVWALITLLCYLVILHGRYANWVGQFGFAAWSAVSFMSVVMAWYGVNFVLGVGLHSYGFATGGTPWVVAFVTLQLLYILAVSGVYHLRRKSGSLPRH